MIDSSHEDRIPAAPERSETDEAKRLGGVATKERARTEPAEPLPAAGPHADARLVNPDATPGTGALTPPGPQRETDAASG
jgi:hypothetical protein